jgi:FixJ family two-component response regulator
LAVSLDICVIDDDPSVRRSTEGLLRSYGHRVRSFASADEYLLAADAQSCACIVSDVQMPGKTGFDLLKEVAQRATPIPVILITAFYDDAVVLKARAAGATCILPKPFAPDDLVACIGRATGA